MTDDAPHPIGSPNAGGLRAGWNRASVIYLAVSLCGLFGTLAFNIVTVVQGRDFLGDWFGSGPAVGSLVVDLVVAAVAGCMLIVVESRRLGMKRAWVYILLALVAAFAFAFPLFLAMRERRMAALSMP